MAKNLKANLFIFINHKIDFAKLNLFIKSHTYLKLCETYELFILNQLYLFKSYRKLFVGGLSWETTEKELRDHFGQYGEIESINIKTDPTTGRSRGFAFIVYKEADSIDKVVVVPEHVINNKKVDPKKAKARTGKIFVGGLIPEISDDEIKAYFGQFGNVS